MRCIIVVYLIFVGAIQVNGQDLSGIASTVFNDLLSSVVSQWGNMSSTDLASFIDKLTQPGGLNHIWNALDSHCNSHFDCGPDACCLKPTHLGKRGFTDGIHLHMSSYCSPLKKLSQTCSLYHSGETTSTFSCPCAKGLLCIPASTFQIHPLISIHKEPICKVA
ncbi:unnamed protein product [Rotaria sordida]|uniref:Uncharacterized protein n=1 Tax=Rotaria sordida TaxID=392033 RepID=A0A818WCB6_9BILA|nr:unnamed protein product [Rotaria sordida]CAF0906606.1 unnamed protein product [Rotaria sordida]CAF3579408.1 unnamed protein product [Rotaria sordida]CAF3723558.1 unnamed protein product [Rotaria sordida]